METKQKTMNIEDAVALAREIARLEAALKQMKAELKAFVEVNGPIVVDDQIWDFAESVSWSFPPEGLQAIAETIAVEGDDPWKYFTLSAESVRRLGWSEEYLLQYGEKKVTRRFLPRKAGDRR